MCSLSSMRLRSTVSSNGASPRASSSQFRPKRSLLLVLGYDDQGRAQELAVNPKAPPCLGDDQVVRQRRGLGGDGFGDVGIERFAERIDRSDPVSFEDRLEAVNDRS